MTVTLPLLPSSPAAPSLPSSLASALCARLQSSSFWILEASSADSAQHVARDVLVRQLVALGLVEASSLPRQSSSAASPGDLKAEADVLLVDELALDNYLAARSDSRRFILLTSDRRAQETGDRVLLRKPFGPSRILLALEELLVPRLPHPARLVSPHQVPDLPFSSSALPASSSSHTLKTLAPIASPASPATSLSPLPVSLTRLFQPRVLIVDDSSLNRRCADSHHPSDSHYELILSFCASILSGSSPNFSRSRSDLFLLTVLLHIVLGSSLTGMYSPELHLRRG